MFATLPLEAFVCREVAETYFWPDEKEFNKKRHVLITSALVFSALIGKRPRSLSLSLFRNLQADSISRFRFSLVNHLRLGIDSRVGRRFLSYSSRILIPFVLLSPSLFALANPPSREYSCRVLPQIGRTWFTTSTSTISCLGMRGFRSVGDGFEYLFEY